MLRDPDKRHAHESIKAEGVGAVARIHLDVHQWLYSQPYTKARSNEVTYEVTCAYSRIRGRPWWRVAHRAIGADSDSERSGPTGGRHEAAHQEGQSIPPPSVKYAKKVTAASLVT